MKIGTITPTMETLEKIFGSQAKVKIMRLFLFNPSNAYGIDTIATKAKIKGALVRKELAVLQKIGLIKRKTFVQETRKKGLKRVRITKKKVKGWTLNPAFSYLVPLQNFLIHINPLQHDEIIKRLSRVGRVKLIIIAGVFIQNMDSRLDLLVVGDHLKQSALEAVIRNIEAEIGKELKYSALETKDFQYRLGMYDKLVRDVLDYPHERVVDKIGLN